MKIYNNITKHSVVSPGVFGARICESKSTFEDHAKVNGDSFLINIKRKIFAVADSPDWTPTTSKEFLIKFDQMIEQLFRDNTGILSDQYGFENSKQILIKHTNRLIQDFDNRSSTTFTCLFVINGTDDLKGMLFHCGDSCIYKVDILQRNISLLSWSNLSLVGRAKKLSQVELTGINENTRFVLCTDGLHVLSRNENFENLNELLLDSFQQSPVDQIPDRLIHHYGEGLDLYDDITIIVLDPNKLEGGGGTFIHGG